MWAAAGALLSACTGAIGAPQESPDFAGGTLKGASPSGSGSVGSNGASSSGKTSTTGANGTTTPAGSTAAPGSTTDDGDSVGGTTITCTTPDVGPSPLRRLTHAEYNNAVADLLGDKTQPASAFAIDTMEGLFDNSADTQTIPTLLADQYLDAATALATAADVPTVAGCDPKAGGATCVKTFLEKFGRRAYRRPLTSQEESSLTSLYTTTTAASDATTGVRATIAAMLASPNFLFRPEFGTATGATIKGTTKVTPYELAGRLASLIWASVPDDILMDAAQSGKLVTKADVATQAQRMLADPRARPAIATFYDQWLGLSILDTTTKSAQAYPTYNDALRDSMREETRRFVANVVWNDDAKLSTLLTADYTFVNAPLAALYGVKGPADAATYQQVNLDPTQRAGVITEASMLTGYARPDESSPIKRGKWLRVRILCQDLPDPPANVPQLPAPMPGVSNRDAIAMHVSNPACSGCHNLIDGLGFGLEQYDGIGQFRTMDQGVAVDSSGDINNTTDINEAFNGGAQLAALLASSDQVRDCAPTQWFRYSMGRREEDADSCSLKSVRDAFASTGGDLKELMVALTQTDVFMNYRQPE
ncbi:MAG TPA: DUF1592 domain-containing protein [Polyangiales bacterium]|nr:DUF1592 domain-containing protein [Polyangiales bacterium]